MGSTREKKERKEKKENISYGTLLDSDRKPLLIIPLPSIKTRIEAKYLWEHSSSDNGNKKDNVNNVNGEENESNNSVIVHHEMVLSPIHISPRLFAFGHQAASELASLRKQWKKE